MPPTKNYHDQERHTVRRDMLEGGDNLVSCFLKSVVSDAVAVVPIIGDRNSQLC